MIVPACGGTEKVFTVSGVRVLYCYDTVEQEHFYLNVDTDIPMTAEQYESLKGG